MLTTHLTPSQAVKAFIAHYDISDDIYSQETIYRTFYKFKKPKAPASHIELVPFHLMQSANQSIQQIYEITDKLITDNLHLFFHANNHFALNRILQINHYCIYHYLGLKQNEIALLFKTSQPIVNHNLSKAQNFINKHTKFRNDLHRLTKQFSPLSKS
jgi:hypothetical protein